MSYPDAYAHAARIWSELPGTHAERSKALLDLIVALKDTQRARRPATPSRAPVDMTKVIASVIGKRLSQVETVLVDIEGVRINLPTLFRAAQEPTHPFAAVSSKFLADHQLALEVTRNGANPMVRIVRKIEHAEELERIKAAASRATKIALNRGLAGSTPIVATDHSGGVTSTIEIQRGDD